MPKTDPENVPKAKFFLLVHLGTMTELFMKKKFPTSQSLLKTNFGSFPKFPFFNHTRNIQFLTRLLFFSFRMESFRRRPTSPLALSVSLGIYKLPMREKLLFKTNQTIQIYFLYVYFYLVLMRNEYTELCHETGKYPLLPSRKTSPLEKKTTK